MKIKFQHYEEFILSNFENRPARRTFMAPLITCAPCRVGCESFYTAHVESVKIIRRGEAARPITDHTNLACKFAKLSIVCAHIRAEDGSLRFSRAVSTSAHQLPHVLSENPPKSSANRRIIHDANSRSRKICFRTCERTNSTLPRNASTCFPL